jgi:glucose uptake protein GlcU
MPGVGLIPGSLMHLSINFVTSAAGVSDSPQLYGLTVGVLVIAAISVVLPHRMLTLRRAPRETEARP